MATSKTRIDYIAIDEFKLRYPDLLDEEIKTLLDRANKDRDGYHEYTNEVSTYHSEDKDADILDLNEIKNLIDIREKSINSSFWKSEKNFDHYFQNYLITHLDIKSLYELLGEQIPLPGPPKADPIQNLADYCNVMIARLEQLKSKGTENTAGTYNPKEPEYTNILSTFSHENGTATPVIQPFSIDLLPNVSSAAKITYPFNIDPLGTHTISEDEVDLFLDLITAFCPERKFEISLRFQKAFMESKYGVDYQPYDALSFRASHMTNSTYSLSDRIDSLSHFYKKLKENILRPNSLQLEDFKQNYREPTAPNAETQKFIEGPIFDYLYEMSLIKTKTDTRLILAKGKLNVEIEKLSPELKEKAQQKIKNDDVENFLKEFDYDTITLTFTHAISKQAIKILIPQKRDGLLKTRGILGLENADYHLTTSPSPSLDLVLQLLSDPQWIYDSSSGPVAIHDFLPVGSLALNRIQKHPELKKILKVLPNSPKVWDETMSQFAQDMEVAQSIRKFPETQNRDNEKLSRYIYDYALLHSKQPLLVFIVLFESYLQNPDIYLRSYLESALPHLYFEFEDEDDLTSTAESGAITVTTDLHEVITNWTTLDEMPKEILIDRIVQASTQNPDTIINSLNRFYASDDFMLNGEGKYYKLEKTSIDYQPLRNPKKITAQKNILSFDKSPTLKRLTWLRPNFELTQEELKQADTNYDLHLSPNEFLSANFSAPAQSYLEQRLKRDLFLRKKLVPVEKITDDLGLTSMEMNLNKMGSDSRPQIADELSNLELLPTRTLISWLKKESDQYIRFDLWQVLVRKDFTEAKALWIQYVLAYEKGEHVGKIKPSLIDVYAPLVYFSGVVDPEIKDIAERLKAKAGANSLLSAHISF